MQFSSLFTAASVLATAFALPTKTSLTLTVEAADDTNLTANGLYSIHEGAAINYVFLGHSDSFKLNTTNGNIYSSFQNSDGQEYEQSLSVLNFGFPGLQVSASGGPKTTWTFEDDYLKGNGSDNFYIAKNTNDPYRYSENSYQIGLFPEGSDASAFEDVHPVKVKAFFF